MYVYMFLYACTIWTHIHTYMHMHLNVCGYVSAFAWKASKSLSQRYQQKPNALAVRLMVIDTLYWDTLVFIVLLLYYGLLRLLLINLILRFMIFRIQICLQPKTSWRIICQIAFSCQQQQQQLSTFFSVSHHSWGAYHITHASRLSIILTYV